MVLLEIGMKRAQLRLPIQPNRRTCLSNLLNLVQPGIRNLFSRNDLFTRAVVRKKHGLDLSLPIAQLSELNLAPYPRFGIRCGDLFQSDHPRFGRLNLLSCLALFLAS